MKITRKEIIVAVNGKMLEFDPAVGATRENS